MTDYGEPMTRGERKLLRRMMNEEGMSDLSYRAARAVADAKAKAALGKCKWYALCDNPAEGVTTHPILKSVPVCKRCADKHELIVRHPNN